MELFAKIVNGFKLLTIFAKSSILDVQQISEDASELCDVSNMSDRPRFSCALKWEDSRVFLGNSPILGNFLALRQKIPMISKYTLHKKWSFPLRISSVNVTKSAGDCGFGHIYWRIHWWKTSFFVQWYRVIASWYELYYYHYYTQLNSLITSLLQFCFFYCHFCSPESLFNEVAGLWNFIKKETLAQVFSSEFCEIF